MTVVSDSGALVVLYNAAPDLDRAALAALLARYRVSDVVDLQFDACAGLAILRLQRPWHRLQQRHGAARWAGGGLEWYAPVLFR